MGQGFMGVRYSTPLQEFSTEALGFWISFSPYKHGAHTSSLSTEIYGDSFIQPSSYAGEWFAAIPFNFPIVITLFASPLRVVLRTTTNTPCTKFL